MKNTLLTLLAFAASVTVSQAALTMLADPTASSASSQFNASFAVTNLYDGSITAADVGTTANQGNEYAGSGEGPHTVVYDMGSAQDIGGFFYASRAGNGTDSIDQISQIEFWFGGSSTNQGDAATFIGANAADFTIDTTASDYQNLVAYDFGSNTNTQYIIMRLTGDGTNNPGGSELMLATHVPEPSSTALLGLGGLALILRRRK